jgi:hypothetical protein
MKSFKLIYFVHLSVFFFLIYYIIIVFKEFRIIHEIDFGFDKDYSFKSLLHTLTNHSLFRGSLILIPPLIGVFLKNKFGWVLITGYVYFFLGSTILQVSFQEYLDFEFILLVIVLISILMSFLLILNFKKSSIQYYKVGKEKLLGYNVISFVCGFVTAFTLVYWNNRHHFDAINL